MTTRRHVSPPFQPANGFTLLELVVGLTITGMIVTAGYSALATVMDRRAEAERILDAAIQAANERRAVRSWLAGARLTIQEGGPAFTGLDGVHEHLPDDALSFLTGAETPLPGGDAVVRLAVDRNPETPATGLIAEFTEWRGSGKRTVEVDRRVTGLAIRYFSIPLGERGWLPSWISRTLLPSAIEVTLVGDSLPPLLRLPMLVPVGTSR